MSWLKEALSAKSRREEQERMWRTEEEMKRYLKLREEALPVATKKLEYSIKWDRLVDKWHKLGINQAIEDVQREFFPESELSLSPNKKNQDLEYFIQEFIKTKSGVPKYEPKIERRLTHQSYGGQHFSGDDFSNIYYTNTDFVITLDAEELSVIFLNTKGTFPADEVETKKDLQNVVGGLIKKHYQS